MRRRALFLLAALALVASSCSTGDVDDLEEASVALVPIADIRDPTAMAVREGDDDLYVAEHTGRIRAVRDGAVDPEPTLDLTDRVRVGYREQGLLGLAFSPDGTRLYAHYTNQDGDTRVDEYAMSGDTADPESRRELLTVDQPDVSHNGGKISFGPDDLLYIALGDGGGVNDRGEGGAPGAKGEPHAPGGNAQSLDTLLGKLLRIDPTPSADKPYAIPPDNPFAAGGGRPEIWAYGLRNPWQFSFDRETTDLWIADVGQYKREEINRVLGRRAAANYGWPRLEGTLAHDGEPPPSGAVRPIFEYAHSDGGCAVVGGFVYRGERIPDLRGAYVFADYCGRDVRTLRREGEEVVVKRLADIGAVNVTAFGEDAAGELYVLSQGQGLLRLDRREE